MAASCWAPDAFQETDITGVTLPITKHNYLVTRADEVAATVREAFYVAKSGRPGPVLIDITKDAQQAMAELDWEAAAPKLRGYRPDLSPAKSEYEEALDLISKAKRPLILAGHGIIVSGAEMEVQMFAEKTSIPVALTLLGLGAFPASHVLNLGMMGMHGEAWVNTAIQEADLLLAFGMRFDDRVTGNLKTYAINSKKIHIEIDPAEINKNIKVDVPLVGDLRKILLELMPRLESPNRREWLERIRGLKGDSAVRDIQNLARQRPSLCGARDQRPVERNPPRRHHRRHRRGPAPDVGGAVLQARTAAFADYFGWTGHDGLRASCCHRRESSAS